VDELRSTSARRSHFSLTFCDEKATVLRRAVFKAAHANAAFVRCSA